MEESSSEPGHFLGDGSWEETLFSIAPREGYNPEDVVIGVFAETSLVFVLRGCTGPEHELERAMFQWFNGRDGDYREGRWIGMVAIYMAQWESGEWGQVADAQTFDFVLDSWHFVKARVVKDPDGHVALNAIPGGVEGFPKWAVREEQP